MWSQRMLHATEFVPHIPQGCFLYQCRPQANSIIGRLTKIKDKFETKQLANTKTISLKNINILVSLKSH